MGQIPAFHRMYFLLIKVLVKNYFAWLICLHHSLFIIHRLHHYHHLSMWSVDDLVTSELVMVTV